MKDTSENKTCIINLRLTEKEKELFKEVQKMVSEYVGMELNMSQTIRWAINNYNKINIR